MSEYPPPAGLNPDPSIRFVEWLTIRTEDHRLKWDLQPNVIHTVLPESLHVQFVTKQCEILGTTWRLFTVRDKDGTELIRAKPPNHESSPPPGLHTLDMAADALFLAIRKPSAPLTIC